MPHPRPDPVDGPHQPPPRPLRRSVSERVDSVALGVAQLVQAMEADHGERPKPWDELTDEDRTFARDIALGVVQVVDGLRTHDERPA